MTNSMSNALDRYPSSDGCSTWDGSPMRDSGTSLGDLWNLVLDDSHIHHLHLNLPIPVPLVHVHLEDGIHDVADTNGGTDVLVAEADHFMTRIWNLEFGIWNTRFFILYS